MKTLTILKFSLASLILATLALFFTVFMKDPARNEAGHIVIYIFASLAVLVAIINVCGGYFQLRTDRRNGLLAPWYKKFRLAYGIVMLLDFLCLLFLFGVFPKTPQFDTITIIFIVPIIVSEFILRRQNRDKF